jgi:hypothetical protein
MRRLLPLCLLGLLAAACGSTRHAATTTAATTTSAAQPAVPRPGPGRVLYRGGRWAVVVDGHTATAEQLVDGVWKPDRTGIVKVEILGPTPNAKAAATPQVAAELIGNAPLVESGLWVDGTELEAKGGGLNPKRGTIYGAPLGPLAPGTHLAVAYGRTAAHATAVAWVFTV